MSKLMPHDPAARQDCVAPIVTRGPPLDPDSDLVEMMTQVAHERHAGACLLVRIEFVGASGLLELFDFDVVTQVFSVALPSALAEAS
jgi:hypothetical protein